MNVGADVRKGGVGERPLQLRHAPVEVVVAGRGGVVADQVHRLDDGVGAAVADARVVGGEGVALEYVAGIEHHHLAGVAPPEGVHQRGDPREAARRGAVGEIIPRGGVAVHVGRRDEDDVGGIRSLGDGERCCEEKREHRPGI